MAVKTQGGLTERQTVESTVLQGDTWASILASVQVDSINKDCFNEGYHIKYKNSLPVGNLGLIDDGLGVTEAGYKAQMLNSYINVKTADKFLQFGPKKCKVMFIGKTNQCDLSGDLTVDKWSTSYTSDGLNGELKLSEVYEGKVKMEKVNQWKYLGFVISNSGNNLCNIREIRKKSIGATKKILNHLNSLHLFQYYFECSVIFKNVFLRPIILYACETYYNLTETEVRQIERNEESYLRQIFSTPRSCPISQLYLESGEYPARFEVKRMKLLFLKYILTQDKSSTIYKFLQLQLQQPRRGEWASTCLENLKELEISLSLEDITKIKLSEYKQILKQQIQKVSLKYLLGIRKIKGSQIEYKSMQMSDYLLPNLYIQSNEDKKLLYALRNQMFQLNEDSFQNKNKLCLCGKEEENITNLYNCQLLNTNKIKYPYEKIYNGTCFEQSEIIKRIKLSLSNREKLRKQ